MRSYRSQSHQHDVASPTLLHCEGFGDISCAAGAAHLGFSDLTHAAVSRTGGVSGASRPTALCIGMGGGTLPLFLAHHYPGLMVRLSPISA